MCHVAHPRRLKVTFHTTDTIRGLKALTKLTKLRSFLGLCSDFRRFVPNFARLVAPLSQTLKKDQPATFGPLNEEKLNCMNSLKQVLISPPILAFLKNSGHIKLDTNACNVQIVCVLLQQQPNNPAKPAGYWSKSLTDIECKYDTKQRESLAIVRSVPLLRLYLKGTRFSIRTDCSSLKWIVNLTESPGRLACRRMTLSEFDF